MGGGGGGQNVQKTIHMVYGCALITTYQCRELFVCREKNTDCKFSPIFLTEYFLQGNVPLMYFPPISMS